MENRTEQINEGMVCQLVTHSYLEEPVGRSQSSSFTIEPNTPKLNKGK